MGLFQTATLHRVLLTLIIVILFYLGYQVMEVFLVPAAWAGILAYVTWPIYLRLRRLLGDGPNRSALIMTLLLTAVLVVPVVWLVFVLQQEAALVYQRLMDMFTKGKLVLPDFMLRLPGIGHYLKTKIEHLNHDPAALRSRLEDWSAYGFSAAGAVASEVSRNLAKLGMTLFTLFFFYRDGETIMQQLDTALQRLIGTRGPLYIKAAGDMTRAVVYGIVLTALAQGFLAGIGYAVAGMDSPVFLAAITTVVAMIPFGTPFAWGSVAIWLFSQGYTGAGIGMVLWGTFVVSWVDNIIRPLVISSATRIPFLLVMFGVLGGLSAFGMVGLFLGPVILAVLMAVWRQWLDAEKAEATPSHS